MPFKFVVNTPLSGCPTVWNHYTATMMCDACGYFKTVNEYTHLNEHFAYRALYEAQCVVDRFQDNLDAHIRQQLKHKSYLRMCSLLPDKLEDEVVHLLTANRGIVCHTCLNEINAYLGAFVAASA